MAGTSILLKFTDSSGYVKDDLVDFAEIPDGSNEFFWGNRVDPRITAERKFSILNMPTVPFAQAKEFIPRYTEVEEDPVTGEILSKRLWRFDKTGLKKQLEMEFDNVGVVEVTLPNIRPCIKNKKTNQADPNL